jgi:hypothetical protein
LAQAAGSMAHRAAQSQCCAPPDGFRARALQHLRLDLDACRRVVGADDLCAGGRAPNEAGGTADRIPDTFEAVARVLERQPHEADESRDERDGRSDPDAGGEPRVAKGRDSFAGHHRSPTLMAGTAVPGVARECAIGKP